MGVGKRLRGRRLRPEACGPPAGVHPTDGPTESAGPAQTGDWLAPFYSVASPARRCLRFMGACQDAPFVHSARIAAPRRIEGAPRPRVTLRPGSGLRAVRACLSLNWPTLIASAFWPDGRAVLRSARGLSSSSALWNSSACWRSRSTYSSRSPRAYQKRVVPIPLMAQTWSASLQLQLSSVRNGPQLIAEAIFHAYATEGLLSVLKVSSTRLHERRSAPS